MTEIKADKFDFRTGGLFAAYVAVQSACNGLFLAWTALNGLGRPNEHVYKAWSQALQAERELQTAWEAQLATFQQLPTHEP